MFELPIFSWKAAFTVGHDQCSLHLNLQFSVERGAFTSPVRYLNSIVQVCQFKNKISFSNQTNFVRAKVIAIMKRTVRDSFFNVMVPEPSSAYLTSRNSIKLCFVAALGDELIIDTMTTGIEYVYLSAYMYYEE